LALLDEAKLSPLTTLQVDYARRRSNLGVSKRAALPDKKIQIRQI
jgi:hypothetical protein